jgi:hypothetical protein
VVESTNPVEAVMLAILTALAPPLVSETICAGLVAFTASFPKASVPGETRSGELFKLPADTNTFESTT